MMLEGMGNKGAIGKGQTIEAFINQRIRTEEAGQEKYQRPPIICRRGILTGSATSAKAEPQSRESN